jgi:hypothetical protein
MADPDAWLAPQGAGSNANHRLRDVPGFRFRPGMRVTAKFGAFFRALVRPRLALPGKYKRAAQEALAERVVCALVIAGPGRVVADSRDTGRPGVRLRAAVWDAIETAGLCESCRGSESSGTVTRYRARPALLDLCDGWGQPVLPPERPPKRSDLVRLHSGNRDLVTGQRLPKALRRRPLPLLPARLEGGTVGILLGRYADLLDRINRENLNHTWVAFVRDASGKRRAVQPSVGLHMTYSGRLFRGGRLYTEGPWSAQNLPKRVRHTMLIDGERVAELDIAAMVLRMVYHREHLDPGDGDLYRPEVILPRFYAGGRSPAQVKAVRRLVKQATILSLNARSRRAAHSSVAHWIARHPHRRFLGRVLRADGLDVPGLVARIVAAHPDIRDTFFTECSAELQSLDGLVMLDTLARMAGAGKPALSLHDGLLVKAADAAFAQRALREVYRDHLGFWPVVRRVY